jgi:hypothetical protein
VKNACLIESHYLPCVAYFACLSRFETIIIERYEHYLKQTYRNRCHIVTSQGIERLTIPLTSKHGKVFITDVKIDYHQKWLNTHWRALETAYRNAPYFEYYSDDLHAVLFKKPAYLFDLNMELLTICLKWLRMDKTIRVSEQFQKEPDNQVTDCRNVIDSKNPEKSADYFSPFPYHQVFGHKFAENVSLIDLVFCEGPNARLVIESSARTMNK